ncbi:MAG: MBL fold metallo-hydrolase [Clostridiales bacterium]|nr:MBL fold metallo-hydrolase [Clostridiales bacterium]
MERITYIGHSGFSLELSGMVLLFDYFEGAMPAFSPEKPLYVFASHAHRDHFNFAVFDLVKHHPNVTYILSRDIRRKWGAAAFEKRGVEKAVFERIRFVRAHETHDFGEIKVTTLDSTDEGVAFLVSAEGKNIFHAGDLHDWVWDDKTEAGNRRMTERFRAEISCLAQIPIDTAFLVLDPRQEGDFARGFDWFMRHTDTRRAYPMHFWNDLSVFSSLRALPESAPYRDKVAAEEEYRNKQ